MTKNDNFSGWMSYLIVHKLNHPWNNTPYTQYMNGICLSLLAKNKHNLYNMRAKFSVGTHKYQWIKSSTDEQPISNWDLNDNMNIICPRCVHFVHLNRQLFLLFVLLLRALQWKRIHCLSFEHPKNNCRLLFRIIQLTFEFIAWINSSPWTFLAISNLVVLFVDFSISSLANDKYLQVHFGIEFNVKNKMENSRQTNMDRGRQKGRKRVKKTERLRAYL